MKNNESKKVALVTGGSRGIGKDIALSLAATGVDVVLTYHSNEQDANNVVETIRTSGGHAAALQLDCSKPASFGVFMDRLTDVLQKNLHADSIDFLINNGGFGNGFPIDALTDESFDDLLNVHFKGVVFLTRDMLRIMNDHGSVVFITAAADRYIVPGYSTYAACKGAIEVFARYVAHEYGSRGIRSNTVAPGGIVTDFSNAAIRNSPKLQEMIVAQTPMGRLGEAHDIGSLVALLCSNDARWLTGQRLEATGGYHL